MIMPLEKETETETERQRKSPSRVLSGGGGRLIKIRPIMLNVSALIL